MLKTIAVSSMLLDHIASILMADDYTAVMILGRSVEVYTILRIIGRLAFPIYSFLLVEGFLHTHDRKRYGLRLFAFALISEIPWNLAHAGKYLYPGQNVFSTLFFAYLGLCCIEAYKDDLLRTAGILAALYAVTLLFRSDFGVAGFGFVLLLYFFRNRRLLQALCAGCFLPGTWAAGLAFIPISFYNGERGYIRSKFLQYTFYAVYPLHLLVLFLIRSQTSGY